MPPPGSRAKAACWTVQNSLSRIAACSREQRSSVGSSYSSLKSRGEYQTHDSCKFHVNQDSSSQSIEETNLFLMTSVFNDRGRTTPCNF